MILIMNAEGMIHLWDMEV